MAKRYYWLKLKEDFFNQKEIKRLRRIAGGDTYTIIYLKLLLLSLKTEGGLYFENIGDDFIDELSLELDEDVENIEVTLSYLQKKGLLEIVSEKEYFLNEIPSLIGSESESARRVRKHRQRKKIEQKETKALHSNANETNGNTEKEKELEKELEKDQEKENVSAVVGFWDNNGFGYNNINAKQKLLKWLDDSSFKDPAKMILKALEIASRNNKRSLAYVEGILNRWEKQSILTIEEVEANEQSKQTPNGYDPNKHSF